MLELSILDIVPIARLRKAVHLTEESAHRRRQAKRTLRAGRQGALGEAAGRGERFLAGAFVGTAIGLLLFVAVSVAWG